MNGLRLILSIFLFLALVTGALNAADSDKNRAQHEKLENFLDCQLKGDKNCRLEKPKKRVEAPPEEDKSEVEGQAQNPAPLPDFIYGPTPAPKRNSQSKGSPR